MRIELLTPDASPVTPPATPGAADVFARVVDDLGAVLERADGAETRYANASGSLGDAVYERARADVALSVATATAQRLAQSLNTVLNMQI